MHIQFGAQHRIPLGVNAAAFEGKVVSDVKAGYVGRIEGDELVLITNDPHGDGHNAAAALTTLEACQSQARNAMQYIDHEDYKRQLQAQTELYQQAVDAVFDFFKPKKGTSVL